MIDLEVKMDTMTVDKVFNDYPEMTTEDYKKMLDKIGVVYEKMPDAILVGGIALRVWADTRGLKIPANYGNDFDVAKPNQESYEVDKSTTAGWIDIFPPKWPTKEPFFTKIEYQGREVYLATIEHLLAMKMMSIQDLYKKYGKMMKKDVIYFQLLRSMVSDDGWGRYIEAIKNERPDLTDSVIEITAIEINSIVKDCIENGKLSDAVHPNPEDI